LTSQTTTTCAPLLAVQLRVARHTDQLAAVVAFYRDGLGLRQIGGFRDHAGYDCAFLELPGTGTHLEFTSGGGHGAPVPHPESLLVLYLGDEESVQAVATRLAISPVAPANPYWAGHGVTFEDPDGCRVVLVPESWSPGASPAPPVQIHLHTGPRAPLRRLFELAEDSPEQLDSYIDTGRVLVAVAGEAVTGHLQLTDTGRPDEAEVKSMAVNRGCRGRGVGRALMAEAITLARRDGRTTLVVATATADTGNLRFYQRLGFRLRSIERDAFMPLTGYPAGREIDGIELRDRVWLDRRIDREPPP
jgi:ribosomal protein S18 acetylase RimI-like enzyme